MQRSIRRLHQPPCQEEEVGLSTLTSEKSQVGLFFWQGCNRWSLLTHADQERERERERERGRPVWQGFHEQKRGTSLGSCKQALEQGVVLRL